MKQAASPHGHYIQKRVRFHDRKACVTLAIAYAMPVAPQWVVLSTQLELLPE